MNNPCKYCEEKKHLPNVVARHWKYHHRPQYLSEKESYVGFIKYIKNLSYADVKDIIDKYIAGVCADSLRSQYGFDVRKLLLLFGKKLRTNSESKKTDTYINKYNNTIRTKYGVGNISQLEEVKEKKRITFLQNHGYENNFCNPNIAKKAKSNLLEVIKNNSAQIKDRCRNTCIDRYGVDNVAKCPEISSKISYSQKRNWDQRTVEERRRYMKTCRNALLKSQHSCRSKLEERVENILSVLNFDIKFNRWVHRKNVDILLKPVKVIVEIQGDYFHASPKKYKETDYFKQFDCTAGDIWKRDAKKREFLQSKGYEVVWIWETEINKMSDGQILEFFIKIYNEHEKGKNKLNQAD